MRINPLCVITILFVGVDIFLVNFNYFDLLENRDNVAYLDKYHCFILFLYLWWCISEFTREYIISIIVASWVVNDTQLLSFASGRPTLALENNPPWTQHFFFFSVFIAPIFSRSIMINNYTILQLILIVFLMLILSSLSIFSLYTTFIPQAIVLCTLVSKFIHIDSFKSYRFEKKHFLIGFQILLFLTICEFFYPKYRDAYNMLHDYKYCQKIIKYLTGHEFSKFPTKTFVKSSDLKYFDRLGKFFANDDEYQLVIIFYALTSIFYKKINQYYENYFVLISILALLVPSFEDPNRNAEEIHFFIFKTYLLIAFGITCSRLKSQKFFLISLILLTALYFRKGIN